MQSSIRIFISGILLIGCTNFKSNLDSDPQLYAYISYSPPDVEGDHDIHSAIYSDGRVIYRNPSYYSARLPSIVKYLTVLDNTSITGLFDSEDELREFIELDRVELPSSHVDSILDGGGFSTCVITDVQTQCIFVHQLFPKHVGRAAEEACPVESYNRHSCVEANEAHAALPEAFTKVFRRLWDFERSDATPWYPAEIHLTFTDATAWQSAQSEPFIDWPDAWPKPLGDDDCANRFPRCTLPGNELVNLRSVLQGYSAYAKIDDRIWFIGYDYQLPEFI